MASVADQALALLARARTVKRRLTADVARKLASKLAGAGLIIAIKKDVSGNPQAPGDAAPQVSPEGIIKVLKQPVPTVPSEASYRSSILRCAIAMVTLTLLVAALVVFCLHIPEWTSAITSG